MKSRSDAQRRVVIAQVYQSNACLQFFFRRLIGLTFLEPKSTPIEHIKLHLSRIRASITKCFFHSHPKLLSKQNVELTNTPAGCLPQDT